MKITIYNGSVTTTLDFDKEGGAKFMEAAKNCINNPEEYPSIDYSDKTDNIIFSAIYLRNSLIKQAK